MQIFVFKSNFLCLSSLFSRSNLIPEFRLKREIGCEQFKIQTNHQIAAVSTDSQVVIQPTYPAILGLAMDALVKIRGHGFSWARGNFKSIAFFKYLIRWHYKSYDSSASFLVFLSSWEHGQLRQFPWHWQDLCGVVCKVQRCGSRPRINRFSATNCRKPSSNRSRISCFRSLISCRSTTTTG
jgi:hypothetical protein